MLPGLVHCINQPQHNSPKVVVLTPTRELAVQVHDVSYDICESLSLDMALCYGGAGRDSQARKCGTGKCCCSN